MFAKTKEFIESYSTLINENKFYELFETAAKNLATHEINELAVILETVLGVEDLDTCRWQVFESEVKDYIDYWLNVPSYMKNRSNSWSRLDYMLEAISNIGFGESDAKHYIIKNAKHMHLSLLPLDSEYGWYGSGDYDLGWFNQEEFKKEFSDV